MHTLVAVAASRKQAGFVHSKLAKELGVELKQIKLIYVQYDRVWFQPEEELEESYYFNLDGLGIGDRFVELETHIRRQLPANAIVRFFVSEWPSHAVGDVPLVKEYLSGLGWEYFDSDKPPVS